jgi:hypothetical protein
LSSSVPTPGDIDRSTISFRQAEGVEALPSQLALQEISPALTARLWSVVYAYLAEAKTHVDYGDSVVGSPWRNILKRWYVLHENYLSDEIPTKHSTVLGNVKKIVTSPDYLVVFEFLQFVIRDYDCPREFKGGIHYALESTQAAYRIVDKTIVPFASEAEGGALLQAFADLSSSDYNGARVHLKMAAEHVTAGKYAESVRESIHSVEAVAKKLEPSASTLGPALHKLQSTVTLNSNMKRGFNALYDYTSDEQGIRHALIENGAAAVDEVDALYMLGACASFVTYLIRKAKL